MKIYNIKNFISSTVSCILGLTLLIFSLIKGFDVKSVCLTIGCLFFGIGGVTRSISKLYTKEDFMEERDERNQYIALKAKSTAFRYTQYICFTTMLLLFIFAKKLGEPAFIAGGVGLSFAFTITMISEIISIFYYEKHG